MMEYAAGYIIGLSDMAWFYQKIKWMDISYFTQYQLSALMPF